MDSTIVIVASLDTKAVEARFLKDHFEAHNFKVTIVDTGVLGEPGIAAHVSRGEVASAGGLDLSTLAMKHDKTEAMRVMQAGAEAVISRLYDDGRVHAIVGIGGTAGTAIATAAMRKLPFGIPKVMVSTVAAGDTSGYLGTKDIMMVPSIVDFAGMNRISTQVLGKTVGAIVGMLQEPPSEPTSSRCVAASMFGNTTPLVEALRCGLEGDGFEVLVFHCTGTGGRTMEEFIDSGTFSLVCDVTTTELADELCEGVFNAGPGRLTSAGTAAIPQVVAPGCLDMVNYGARHTVPTKYQERLLYEWNSEVTLMRTSSEECSALGAMMAQRLNQAKGPVHVLIPEKGLSQLDAADGPFWDPAADKALFDALKATLRSDIELQYVDCNINDPVFSKVVLDTARSYLH